MTTKLCNILAMTLVASLASVTSPSGAADVVGSGGGSTSGWVAMRVTLTPEPWTFLVESRDATGTAQVGYAMYRADGSILRNFSFTVGDEDHGVGVRGNGVPTQQIPNGLEVLPGESRLTFTGSMNGSEVEPDVGTFFVVLWTAQKTGSWTWNVGGGIEILAENEGERSIAITSEDLDGTLSAHVRPVHRYGGPGAYVGTNVRFDIEHAFIGAGQAPLVHSHALVVTRPDGREITCSCAPRAVVGPTSWGPGRYAVRHDGVDVVLTGGTDVHLMGVDVELPWGSQN